MAGVDAILQAVSALCPARPAQLRTLLNLLGTAHDQPLPASILLQDACSPETTAVYAQTLLQNLATQPAATLHAAIVSPLTDGSGSALFRDLLQPIEDRIAALGSQATSPASTSRRTDGSLDWFLWRMASLLDANPTHRVAILIKNAERIRDMWPETIWTAFSRLAELTASRGRITTIFVSSVPWSNFRIPSGLTTAHSPIVIRFPRHTKEEVLSILALDLESLYAAYHASVDQTQRHASTSPGLCTKQVRKVLKKRQTGRQVDKEALRRLHNNFVGIFYESIKSYVRDITEMRVMSAAVWHAFVVPVQAGEASTTDTQILLLASSALFREVLFRLQTREVGPKEWAEEVRFRSIEACKARLQVAAVSRIKQQQQQPQQVSTMQDMTEAGAADGDLIVAARVEATDDDGDEEMVDEETKIDEEEWLEKDLDRIKRRRLSTQLATTSTLPSLPLIPTFLLLASFLASYNPARLDVRYFLRDSSLLGQSAGSSLKPQAGGRKLGPGRGRRAVRRGRPAKGSLRITNEEGQTENLSRQELLGPKPFPLDRLIGIFQALVTESAPELNVQLALSVSAREVDDNGFDQEADVGAMWEQRARSVGVYAQINNLVSRRMLVRTSAVDKLGSSINFRTNVSYTVVSALARKVRFDLDEWLWDWGGGGAGAA